MKHLTRYVLKSLLLEFAVLLSGPVLAEVTKVGTVAVLPIRTTDLSYIYQRSVKVIVAFRNAGFNVGAVKNREDVPVAEPSILVSAHTYGIGCLDGDIELKNFPGKDLTFEVRIDRWIGAMKRDEDACTREFVRAVIARLKTEKLY